MGNRQTGSNDYMTINGDDYSIHDIMTQEEVLEEFGPPMSVENFYTGFHMYDSVCEDKVIVNYGKYIYERFVYENDIVYFMKYNNQKYAWSVQSNAM